VNMRRGNLSVRRVGDLVDVAASWPGVTLRDAAAELHLSISSVKTYAAAGRRWGLIWAGYVPRLVDSPQGPIPFEARVRMSDPLRAVYGRICRSWMLQDPIRLHDLTREGLRRSQANDYTTRLRALGLLAPPGTLYATADGYALANYSAGGSGHAMEAR
jgi:hypothetical protein